MAPHKSPFAVFSFSDCSGMSQYFRIMDVGSNESEESQKSEI
jgi:hypothetical protein